MPQFDSGGRKFFIKSDCAESSSPVEMFSIEKQKHRLVLASGEDLIDYTRTTMMDSKDSLPFFAELYNISADINDYIMVPVVIMPSELPNRNIIGFPFNELIRANAEAGCLGYQTWKNKSTFQDHCFPEDAPIQTKKGHKAIKDIKIGDKVLTHTKQWKKVTELFSNGKKWVSQIRAQGVAKDIYGTENHPLWVIDRRQFFENITNDKRGVCVKNSIQNISWQDLKPHFRPISDIYAGDYLVVPIAIGGDIQVDSDFAFITGVVMAEGSYGKYRNKPNCVFLTIGYTESEYKQAIVEKLNRLNLPYTIAFHRKNNTCSIIIRDRDFAMRMQELCGDYAHKKCMRGELRNWNKKAIKNFLGGYISGDGSIANYGQRKLMRCRTASLDLATDIQHALGFVGIASTVNFDGKPTTYTYFCKRYAVERLMQGKGSYCVSAYDWEAWALSKYIVGKSPMTESNKERTWKKVHLIDGHLLVPVCSVKHKYKMTKVYNIEVEEDHSYVAYGVVVHNCNKDYTKSKGIIFAASMRPLKSCLGNLQKVICLCGYDRTTDPILVNSILTKQRNSYSMGAWTSKFTCSICASDVSKDKNNPACEHVGMKQPKLSFFNDSKGRKQLAYLQARNILGFEVSSVITPAYLSATTNDMITWNDAA